MTERPNPIQILADELLAAGVDRNTAANICAKVSTAFIAQKQWDDMERWRAQQAGHTDQHDGEGK